MACKFSVGISSGWDACPYTFIAVKKESCLSISKITIVACKFKPSLSLEITCHSFVIFESS